MILFYLLRSDPLPLHQLPLIYRQDVYSPFISTIHFHIIVFHGSFTVVILATFTVWCGVPVRGPMSHLRGCLAAQLLGTYSGFPAVYLGQDLLQGACGWRCTLHGIPPRFGQLIGRASTWVSRLATVLSAYCPAARLLLFIWFMLDCRGCWDRLWLACLFPAESLRSLARGGVCLVALLGS